MARISNKKINPICARCQLVMVVKENAVLVRDPEVQDGPGRFFPSTFWRGDLYQCPSPDCEMEIIADFGVGSTPGTSEDSPAYKKHKPKAMLFHHKYEDLEKDEVEQRV